METLQKIFSMFAFSPFSFRIEPVILSQKNSEGAKKMSRLVSTYQRNESIKNSSDGDNRFDFCGRFEFLLIPAKVFRQG